MFKSKWTFPFLCLLLLVETVCLYTNTPFFIVGSLCYFISGLAIAIFPLFFPIQSEKQIPIRVVTLLYISLSLLFANWMFNLFRLDVLQGQPPIKEHADMLLFIKVMAERFIAGDAKIYAKISEVWGGEMAAPYLPTMWLPYALPITLGLDMRWASFVFAVLSILMVFAVTYHSRLKWNWSILILPSFALLVNRLLCHHSWYFTQTEEGVVLLYYALFCIGLLYANWSLIGISIGLCLLSRFIPVIMIPAVFLLLNPKYKSQFWETFAYSVTTVLLIFLFTGTYDEIIDMASIPLKYHEYLNVSTNPYLLSLTGKLGMLKFFTWSGKAVMSMALPLTLVSTFIMAFALKKWNPDIRIEYQLLCLLKLTLVIFLNFQIGVDEYLLYTSSIVSLFLVIGYANSFRKNVLSPAN